MVLRALATAVALAGTAAQQDAPPDYFQEGSPWYKQGQYEVRRRAQTQANTKRAKNVILFVADGMYVCCLLAQSINRSRELLYRL